MPTDEREQGIQLGKILAQGDEQDRKITAVFVLLDKIRQEQAETSGIAKEALRLSTETSVYLKANITPHVEDYRNLKAKGLGVLGVIAIMGGGAATVAGKVWVAFWGH